MNIQAVMISMVNREESAEATAKQFRDIGIPVEIFTQPADWGPGQASNNKNSARALTWFLENSRSDLLFLEDDLLIKPDRMLRGLEAAKEKEDITYFYMHEVPARRDRYPKEGWIDTVFSTWQYHAARAEARLEGIVAPEGLRPVTSPKHSMFGSQCVYMPRLYAKFLLDEMSYAVEYTSRVKAQPTRAMDTALNDFRINHRLHSYVYLPHPVQHLLNRTGRKKASNDRVSRTFNLPSDKE